MRNIVGKGTRCLLAVMLWWWVPTPAQAWDSTGQHHPYANPYEAQLEAMGMVALAEIQGRALGQALATDRSGASLYIRPLSVPTAPSGCHLTIDAPTLIMHGCTDADKTAFERWRDKDRLSASQRLARQNARLMGIEYERLVIESSWDRPMDQADRDRMEYYRRLQVEFEARYQAEQRAEARRDP